MTSGLWGLIARAKRERVREVEELLARGDHTRVVEDEEEIFDE